MIDRTMGTAAGMDSTLPEQRALPEISTGNSVFGLINGFFEWFGELGLFSWQVLRAAVTPPFEFRELFRQIDEIGSKSFPLVALAGAAIGAILSLETRDSLVRFGAKFIASRRRRVLDHP